ncbi:hypothetical protein BN132_2840 [Cronobacter turicensis 564]|nr:hypothetical protein BN132_2840 [Cronobacter turicensis 564]
MKQTESQRRNNAPYRKTLFLWNYVQHNPLWRDEQFRQEAWWKSHIWC